MRMTSALRLLTLIAFALFGGALPVAAAADHAVICGADGVKRVVAYDFETGKPIEVDLAEADCQDCFGVSPILGAAPALMVDTASESASWPNIGSAGRSGGNIGLPPVRAPPSLVI